MSNLVKVQLFLLIRINKATEKNRHNLWLKFTPKNKMVSYECVLRFNEKQRFFIELGLYEKQSKNISFKSIFLFCNDIN